MQRVKNFTARMKKMRGKGTKIEEKKERKDISRIIKVPEFTAYLDLVLLGLKKISERKKNTPASFLIKLGK